MDGTIHQKTPMTPSLCTAIEQKNKADLRLALKDPQSGSVALKALKLAQKNGFDYGVRQLLLHSAIDWRSEPGVEAIKDMVSRYISHQADDLSALFDAFKAMPQSTSWIYQLEIFTHAVSRMGLSSIRWEDSKNEEPFPHWSEPLSRSTAAFEDIFQKVWRHPWFVANKMPRTTHLFCVMVFPTLRIEEISHRLLRRERVLYDLWKHVEATLLPLEWVQASMHYAQQSTSPPTVNTLRAERLENCDRLLLKKPAQWWDEVKRHFKISSKENQEAMLEKMPIFKSLWERDFLLQTVEKQAKEKIKEKAKEREKTRALQTSPKRKM